MLASRLSSISLSAYVPCYNNASTISRALSSLNSQAISPCQLFLVDDSSLDSSISVAESLGIDVVALPANLGRGAVRRIAVEYSSHEFILSCDATNYLPPDFTSKALAWFSDPQVAAVYGRFWQNSSHCVADRWRGRHLFLMDDDLPPRHHASLSTYGCLLRRAAVLQCGNFNPALRHSEDADLGQRLIASGFDVIFDPSLFVYSGVVNTPFQVLERYWRWYAGANESISLLGYCKQIWYSLKVMIWKDLSAHDPQAALLSLACPHFQFWYPLSRRLAGKNQA